MGHSVADVACAIVARIRSVLMNYRKTYNVGPNAGLHAQSLAQSASNVEHAEPIGISGHYSDST